MNEMQTPVVAAPVAQPVALTNNINPEVPANPLDELAAAIETFKLKLKASFDEASTLARKVKEAQIARKQKLTSGTRRLRSSQICDNIPPAIREIKLKSPKNGVKQVDISINDPNPATAKTLLPFLDLRTFSEEKFS